MKTKRLLFPIIALLSIASCSPSSVHFIDSSKPTSSSGSSSSQNFDAYKPFQLNNPQKAFNKGNTATNAANTAYVSSLNAFSKDLYKNIFDGDNKIYSTISIANCFSMLLEGAKENSRKELETLLHYDDSFDHLNEIKNTLLRNAIDDADEETYLDISQSFWADQSFKNTMKQAYIDALTNYYYAEAFSGDLKSDEMHAALADYINDKTHNFLNVKKEDFHDYAGVLWLLNTVYLKSQWFSHFEESFNKEDLFTNLNGNESKVTYMNQTTESYYQAADNYAIASLSLKHSLRFNILLPNKGTNYADVLKSDEALDGLHNFPSYIKGNSAITPLVKFQVPQFKIQRSIDLSDLFKTKMGVKDIFDPEAANLRDIAELLPDENLYVSKAKHEAGIEVKNEGLEAAAYTIIAVDKATSVDPKPVDPIEFIVDHPFAYSITNIDGIPLFTGVVTTL